MNASRFTLHASLLLALLALLAPVALAQTGGYDLTWSTVDGGGYTWSTGGAYALGGTVGQPEAGVALTGGGYTLVGGFWSGVAVQYRVYLPLVLRNY
ncbi:MAG: hypothetical protein H5T61_01740 [Thermoflexales bacterium]|nr:hypothetical protein [Thermoflexales bacterium]